MAKRRELTPSEINAAERLQTIWNEKKKALGLTQEKVAQLCEWSNQSAFGACAVEYRCGFAARQSAESSPD